jgi:ribosomal protein S18 acetylase RimI-like enzyme
LRQVEAASAQRFREVGLDAIADDEPTPAALFEARAASGGAWVAVSPSSGAVGFVIVEVVDDAAHIEQVSVVPAHQGWRCGVLSPVPTLPPERAFGRAATFWAIAWHLPPN